MPRKKVDSRVRTLIENGVKSRERSFFVIIGDHGKDQVVNLHYILSKARIQARPNVLWCYKKELGFSTHKKKRMKEIQKKIARGLHDPDKDDPFELFITSTKIRWCYYKETQNILGQTFGVCILQDFEALTPNLLCRTIETVEGGGLVILLLKSMNSLKQFYTMTMDVHARFRTDAHHDVVPRFNERFILSLASCRNCLVLDDELNVLPISKHAKNIQPLVLGEAEEEGSTGAAVTPAEKELRELKTSLAETELVGSLVSLARTLDQAKAVLTCVEAISEKTLRSTVAITAGRGRGKSAALGVSVAAAVAYGYSNIFITSPSPENLTTLFEFVFKAFDALAYTEHLDYEVQKSQNPEFNEAVVRVNIFRTHRQTIQYVQPQDAHKLGQAELVVIDEAAAIPLPLVKAMLGPYLVFMASTINGYEGTGRSLSLKLLQQLRQSQDASAVAAAAAAAASGGASFAAGRADSVGQTAAARASVGGSGRLLREVNMKEPIRYASNDAVEAWMNELLCLDATVAPYSLAGGHPHPKDCELFYVNRDALFSYHKMSEAFLQSMMALYVASHYKNTPNDLQLMSDAPAHQLFVLLAPVKPDAPAGTLPDILCVIQVALEGDIARETVQASLARGQRASGDLIPWTLAQQFQDNQFSTLSGARVVRIASHPDAIGMGYGSRALELLAQYYQGDLTVGDVSTVMEETKSNGDTKDDEDDEDSGALDKKLKPRSKLPPLLSGLNERKPERLHWLGVSFGVTLQLFKFWNRAGYMPTYVRHTSNDITAEHTAILLRPLKTDDLLEAPATGWLSPFVADFGRRFVSLLSMSFRSFHVQLAFRVLDACQQAHDDMAVPTLDATSTALYFSQADLKRLDSYARNLVDYHVVIDLLPQLGRLLFLRQLKTSLSPVQSLTLVGMCLQHKDVDKVAEELSVPASQLLALFNKAVRRLNAALNHMQEEDIEREMEPTMAKAVALGSQAQVSMQPLTQSLSEELEEGAKTAELALHKKQREFLESSNLMEFAVEGTDDDWKAALASGRKGAVPSTISVKSAKQTERAAAAATAAAASDADGAGKTPSKRGHEGKGHQDGSRKKHRTPGK